jgi:hypothetical protein
MAKYPAPGRVKTRLAAAIGAEAAARLGEALIRDLADRLRALPYRVTWAYWPSDAPFDRLVPHACCRPQRGADLGERMAAAIDAELQEAPGPVLVLGADVAHVSETVLGEAANVLHEAADLVVGPATDGGYYLIGMTALHAELFAGIAWGTSAVLASTLERAAGIGLRTHLLPETFDVDEPADLVRLRAVIDAQEVAMPATRRVLDRL